MIARSTPKPERHAVLVVDDERENLNLIENVLREECDVLKAKDAASALRTLARRPVDMIISDQRMSGMKGVELLERARTIRPDAVRILISAYPDIAVAVDAINRGQVQRYVSKPFDPEELRSVVRREFEFYRLRLANRDLNDELGRVVGELMRANRRLKDLDRMKDTFLADVSHELRTPLVSSLGYVDLVLEGGLGEVAPPAQRGLRIAFRNLQRLLSLIEDLLALARLKHRRDALDVSAFDLRELIDECVASLRGRSRKKALDVHVQVAPGLPPVRADEKRVHGVLTNVLANAEKFTPDKAKIRILVTRARGGRCTVRVQDNGSGPAVGRRSDFPAFATEGGPRSGLGIGLSLAQKVLRMHGCSISLERAHPTGAAVSFDLPLAVAK